MPGILANVDSGPPLQPIGIADTLYLRQPVAGEFPYEGRQDWVGGTPDCASACFARGEPLVLEYNFVRPHVELPAPLPASLSPFDTRALLRLHEEAGRMHKRDPQDSTALDSRLTYIEMNCTDATGEQVTLFIPFRPYFFVHVTAPNGHAVTQEEIDWLEWMLRFKSRAEKELVHIRYESWRLTRTYQPRKKRVMRVQFPNSIAMSKALGWLRDPTGAQRHLKYRERKLPMFVNVLCGKTGRQLRVQLIEDSVPLETQVHDQLQLYPQAWLRVTKYRPVYPSSPGARATMAAVEALVEPRCIEVLPAGRAPAPKLVAVMDIETTCAAYRPGQVEQCDPTNPDDEIVCVNSSLAWFGSLPPRFRARYPDYKLNEVFLRVAQSCRPCSSQPGIVVEEFDEELGLLDRVRDLWQVHLSIDGVFTWNGWRFDDNYLYERARVCHGGGVSRFHFLDRCLSMQDALVEKELTSDAMGKNMFRFLFAKRYRLDGWFMDKKNVKRTYGSALRNVAREELQDDKDPIKYYHIFETAARGTREDMDKVIKYCAKDCDLVVRIVDKLGYFMQTLSESTVMYTPFDQIVISGQQLRIVNQFVLFAHRNGFLVDGLNDNTFASTTGYDGGMVLNPVKALYKDPVAVLDFASLYPTLIRAYNVDFTTYVHAQDVPRLLRERHVLVRVSVQGKQHHFLQHKRRLLPCGPEEAELTREDVRALQQLQVGETVIPHEFTPGCFARPSYFTNHITVQFLVMDTTSAMARAVGADSASESATSDADSARAAPEVLPEMFTAPVADDGAGDSCVCTPPADLYFTRDGLVFTRTEAEAAPFFRVQHVGHYGLLPQIEMDLAKSRKEAKLKQSSATATAHRAKEKAQNEALSPEEREEARNAAAHEDAMARMYGYQQLALKQSMNSIYGFTGASEGRYPFEPIAASITALGRTALQKCIAYLETLYAHTCFVIYGDTDSVMPLFRGMSVLEVVQLCLRLEQEMTSIFPAPMEMEFENLFVRFYAMKSKKYIAYAIAIDKNRDGQLSDITREKIDKYVKDGARVGKQYVKGLQVVRRDCAPFVQRLISELVAALVSFDVTVNTLFSIAHKHLQRLVGGQVPLADLCPTTEMKPDGEYSRTRMPYPPFVLTLAWALKRKFPDMEPQSGDRIPYAIVVEHDEDRIVPPPGRPGTDGFKTKALQKREKGELVWPRVLHYRHPQEIEADPANNHVDVLYYLEACETPLVQDLLSAYEGLAIQLLDRFRRPAKELRSIIQKQHELTTTGKRQRTFMDYMRAQQGLPMQSTEEKIAALQRQVLEMPFEPFDEEKYDGWAYARQSKQHSDARFVPKKEKTSARRASTPLGAKQGQSASSAKQESSTSGAKQGPPRSLRQFLQAPATAMHGDSSAARGARPAKRSRADVGHS